MQKLILKGQGIWLGNGFGSQALLKCVRAGVRFNENAPDDMGYYVMKNKSRYVKYVSKEEEK